MKTMKTWHLAVGLAIIFITGVVIIAVVRCSLRDNGGIVSSVDIEIAKAALNGCIIAVIGAVIAALIKAREQSVQAARLRSDLLGQFFQQLGELYRSVKATRRRLRSLGLTSYYGSPPGKLDAGQLKAYAEEMTSIEKAQLSLENLKIQVMKLPPFDNLGDVAQQLRNMEDYLRVLLKERESVQSNIHSGKDVTFNTLVRLNEFTTSTSKDSPVPLSDEKPHYRFSTQFADAYDDILENISHNLRQLTNA